MTYAPGIYFESGPNPNRTIAMAMTSLTVFVGVDITVSGDFPAGDLKLISKSADVDAWITDNQPSSDLLKDAMKSYFIAGGKFCYLAHVDGSSDAEFTATLEKALNRNGSLSLVAFPGSAVDDAVHAKHYGFIMSYAASRKDLFVLVDTPQNGDGSTKNYSGALTYFSGRAATSYAASYYPWVTVNGADFIPPSAIIAALYGQTDNDIGVHQVAAGVQHGILTVAVDVRTKISQNQHLAMVNADAKNLKLNVIRALEGVGVTAWGARTMDDGEFKHINVRRLFIFAEQSIKNSLQWVVFEPNNKALWGSVNRSITAFLKKLWQQGALVGKKESEAFYVKIDEENNPASERDAGKLNIEIGIAPSHPAEFIIIKLIQSTQS